MASATSRIDQYYLATPYNIYENSAPLLNDRSTIGSCLL